MMDAPTRLSDWPWVEVKVDCKLCPRHGCYRLVRLAARFGPEIELGRLLAILARDCPYWRNNPRQYEARCGARFTEWDHQIPKLERSTSAGARGRYTPIGATRVLTLNDLPGPVVAIVCEQCRRRGVYRVAGLLVRFGAELPLPTILLRLAHGCPASFERTLRCQARYDPPPGC